MKGFIRNITKLLSLATAVTLGLSGVRAAPITVASYDMLNGQGTAIGATYDYWDDSYNGTGSTTTDLASLTGGTGDLTDGIISTNNFYVTEPPAGPGPYVGWFTIDPLISFYFGGIVTINSVTLHLDDSNGIGTGQVNPPSSVTIGGTNYAITDPTSGDPLAFTVSGLGLTVSSLDIQLFRQSSRWVFLSEVQFDDGLVSSIIPEPDSLALFGAGLFGLGVLRRRLSQKPCNVVP